MLYPRNVSNAQLHLKPENSTTDFMAQPAEWQVSDSVVQRAERTGMVQCALGLLAFKKVRSHATKDPNLASYACLA